MSLSTSVIASYAPLGVGIMLMGSGLYGILHPLNMIRYFGLPWAEQPHSRIYPAVGVRNLSAGIATMILSLTGRRESVGVLLASWLAVGVVDTSIVVRDERSTQRALHAINTVVLTFISSLALCEGKYGAAVDNGLVSGLGIGLGMLLVNGWVLN